MDSPITWRNELEKVIEVVENEIKSYISRIDEIPAKLPSADLDAMSISDSFPKTGIGAFDTLKQLIEFAHKTSVSTSGPKCFHFVIGGSTPASLGADWLASLYDQMAYAWVSSPMALQLEIISLRWLSKMFEIPPTWGSIITTGATMSNFVGLAAARQWAGNQQGIDVAEKGCFNIPPISVLTSGHVHASTLKALAMLGIGRANCKIFAKEQSKDLDLIALEKELSQISSQPCILVATAGEPNAGAFDPIEKIAALAKKYNCWLHIDGAFGLFGKLSPRTSQFLNGIEKAHSITVDGHKWLNVPYDCGFAFVKDKSLMVEAFRYTAEYLPPPDDPSPVMGAIGPESSRRARALSVWATLKAYGHKGYTQLIEHHLDLAQYLEHRIFEEDKLEILAPVKINVVCFRYKPNGYSEPDLNKINKRLGEAIIRDGRVYLGTTILNGKTALRPAISNWRTEQKDINLMVDVILELGHKLSS